MECSEICSADALKGVVIALEIHEVSLVCTSWISGWRQLSMRFFNIPHKIHSSVTVLLHFGSPSVFTFTFSSSPLLKAT